MRYPGHTLASLVLMTAIIMTREWCIFHLHACVHVTIMQNVNRGNFFGTLIIDVVLFFSHKNYLNIQKSRKKIFYSLT